MGNLSLVVVVIGVNRGLLGLNREAVFHDKGALS